jgi:hypothetical protein
MAGLPGAIILAGNADDLMKIRPRRGKSGRRPQVFA